MRLQLILSLTVHLIIILEQFYEIYLLQFGLFDSMATHIYSDEETVDKYDYPSVEHLLKQNKMKDIALNKATNLIQLLNIQLEVERNSNQENIRLIQQEIKYKYEAETIQLKQKIYILQRQVNKLHNNIHSNQKTVRQSLFSRANSTKSLQNKRKVSVNKKYTQTLTNEEADRPEDLQIFSSIYKEQIIEFQIWKKSLLNDLNTLIKQEYDQLGLIINSIEAISEDYDQIANYKIRSKKNLQEEMAQIIKSQNILINSLRAYSQELQDLCKSTNYKLGSTLSKSEELIQTHEFNFLEPIISKVRQTAASKKQVWKKDLTGLQSQNSELKNILDSMIKLVQQQKKLRI